MGLRVARFLMTWRDFGESRQCDVAHWLETKWVSFVFSKVEAAWALRAFLPCACSGSANPEIQMPREILTIRKGVRS